MLHIFKLIYLSDILFLIVVLGSASLASGWRIFLAFVGSAGYFSCCRSLDLIDSSIGTAVDFVAGSCVI